MSISEITSESTFESTPLYGALRQTVTTKIERQVISYVNTDGAEEMMTAREVTKIERRAYTDDCSSYADLVFEGGGLKGIGLIGAYSVLEERGFRPQNMAGASAGSIVAALVAAGYSAAELREIIAGSDFEALKGRGRKNRLPLFVGIVSILKNRGIYEGKAFLDWMEGLLEAKGVRTFGDLVRRPGAELRFRYKLQVIASDLTEQRLLVLPKDAHRLGIEDPDELEVALAVRMSTSIPIIFEPVSFTNPKTGREHLIVDGGMLSNFPVWLFDAKEPLWPTIGLKFVEEHPRAPLATSGSEGGLFKVVDFARSLVNTMMGAHDRFYLEETDFDRTIAIDPLGVGTAEFGLSEERAAELYESGRSAAEKFLSRGWNVAALNSRLPEGSNGRIALTRRTAA